MSKSKLTLIVDGNWLLMSRMSVINNRYADDVQMCHDLKLMMIKSINVVLRQFPLIDNVIFVADGGSWRNHLEIPNFLINNKLTEEEFNKVLKLLEEYVKTHDIPYNLDELTKDNCTVELLRRLDDFDFSSLNIEQVEYKGNRVKSDEINWDLIFKSYEDFIATLNSTGITAVKEPGVEGDDWAWYWSEKLNAEGTNVIVWTKDKDLTQLVKIDKNKCFTIWWNKDSGIIAPEFNDDDMDFLFNPELNQNEELYNSIVNKSKEVTQINPKNVVIDKIIRGDAGDNILPVIQRKAKSESSMRLYKVSTKDINFDLDIHNEEEIREYFTTLLSSKNYLGRVDKTVNEVVEHFKYNVKLVTLEKNSYPDEIIEIMNNYNDYTLSKDTSQAESVIAAEAYQIDNILNII